MKKLLWSVMFLATYTAIGGDIIVKVPGPDGLKTVVLSTNDTTLVDIDWEAVKGGGADKVQGRLDKDSVVLTETVWSIDDGIRTDSTNMTIVPTNKIPREVTIGSRRITVLRGEKGK